VFLNFRELSVAISHPHPFITATISPLAFFIVPVSSSYQPTISLQPCLKVHPLQSDPQLLPTTSLHPVPKVALVQSQFDDEVISRKFSRLANEWRRGRGMSSSLKKLMAHPAYVEIISLKAPVVPYILAELERKPDWWFTALQEITKEDPVSPRSRGRLNEMAIDWLRWGRRNNIRW